MKRRSLIAPLIVALLLCGVAFAASYVEEADQLPGAPSAVLGAPISSIDTATLASPLRPRLTNGCPKVVIVPTFSTAGATATLEVIGYQRINGVDTFATLLLSQSVTASSTVTSDGTRFICTDGYLVAPTLGCQTYDVRLRAISGGTATWTSWRLGVGTKAATTASE